MILPATVANLNLSPKQQLAVGLLYRRTMHSQDAQMGFYQNVHSDEWITVLGRNYYKATLTSLEDMSIFDTNDRYSVGKFSKSYRLTENHCVPMSITAEVAPHQKLPQQIRIADSDEVGRHLLSNFKNFILPNKKFKGWDRPLVQQIREQDFYAVRCAYGRFHSSLCGLSKAARASLTLRDGQHVFEIDVSHAQPSMIPALMAVAGYVIDKSTRRFIQLCQSGTLYDHIASLCRQRGINLKDCYQPGVWKNHWAPQEMNRNPAKKSFIVILFCPNAMMLGHPVYGILQEAFPAVAQFMLDTKQAAYQQLARQCQEMEARIMIDGVCGDLLRDHPHIPLFSVHDSIATTAGHVPVVAATIWRHFAEYGMRPTLKANGAILPPNSIG